MRRVVALVRGGPGGQGAGTARAEDLEVLALRAFTLGDSSGQREALTALRGASDATLVITAWTITLYSRNVRGGEAVTRLLAEPLRNPYVRVVGYVELAYVAAAQGKLREAETDLAAADRLDQRTAAEYAVLLAAAPFLSPSSPKLGRSLDLLARAGSPAPVPASASIYFTVHQGLHREIEVYLRGLLAMRAIVKGALRSR